MTNNPNLAQYLNSITQKIDWLITACSGSVVARESARDHLINGVKEIISEVYNVGFMAGEKSNSFNNDQKLRVAKYKLQERLEKENKKTRKEILDIVLKEYGLKDEKINIKLRKKIKDEVEMETSVSEQDA
jgi:hypothetical protein